MVAHAAAASESVLASTLLRTSRPCGVSAPLESRRPRAARPVADASQISGDQPRLSRSTDSSTPRSAANSMCVSQPSIRRARSAATWPSPRCSRKVVHCCHSSSTGSSRRGSARFASNNGDSIKRGGRRTASRNTSFTFAARSSAGAKSRRNARAADSTRASRSAAGVANRHASGTDRATIDGAKL